MLNLRDVYYISDKDYGIWTRNIEAKEGDCVITNTGKVGVVAQITKKIKCAIGRNITSIRPDINKVTPTYLINYLLSRYMFKEIYRKTDIGTILDSLNVKGIKNF